MPPFKITLLCKRLIKEKKRKKHEIKVCHLYFLQQCDLSVKNIFVVFNLFSKFLVKGYIRLFKIISVSKNSITFSLQLYI